MHEVMAINNMYAAYSAASSNIDKKNVSELSRMMKNGDVAEKKTSEADEKTMQMDKVIISAEALNMLKSR